jgi:hypothetical protein
LLGVDAGGTVEANNVGIGIATPTEKLHVVGNVRISEVLYISSLNQLLRVNNNEFEINNYSSDKPILFKTSDGGSIGERMRLTSDGELGIGTSDPQKKLDIAGGDIRLDNSKGIYFSTLDANIGRVKIIGDESNDFIQMNVDNSNNHVIKLTTTGVGIGTTSPSEKLEVAGKAIIRKSGTATAHGDTDLLVTDATAASSTAAIQILGGNAGFSNLQFSDTDSYSQGAIIYGHTDNFMAFKANASEKMRLTSTGLGIGTSSPQELVHLFKQSHSNPLLIEVENDGYLAGTSAGIKLTSKATDGVSGSWTIDNLNRDTLRFLDDGSEKMRLTSGGNLLINTTTDTGFKLNVNAPIITTGYYGYNNTNIFYANVQELKNTNWNNN